MSQPDVEIVLRVPVSLLREALLDSAADAGLVSVLGRLAVHEATDAYRDWRDAQPAPDGPDVEPI